MIKCILTTLCICCCWCMYLYMVCVSQFSSLLQSTWKNNLKIGKFFFLWFQRFQCMVGLLYCYVPVARQNIMVVGECGRTKLFSSWWPERRGERGQGQNLPLKAVPPVTDLLQVGPTSYFPPSPKNVMKFWILPWINPPIRWG
jgi:hypothetical protein